MLAAESKLRRRRAYFADADTVTGTFQVSVAAESPLAGDAQARSVALSNVPFALKSIQPHSVAVAVTPTRLT